MIIHTKSFEVMKEMLPEGAVRYHTLDPEGNVETVFAYDGSKNTVYQFSFLDKFEPTTDSWFLTSTEITGIE